ncbi:MAG: hypothetical protein JXR84_22485, partial [Anaerolineae bacterium]|nr:hypothetical protein [Anaerolineae bacterium]
MPSLELYLLGDFRILLDGQPLTGFRSDKARALLAYLAVENGRQHDRAILATLLWGEHPDDAARASLRTTLSNLHQMLDFLVCDAPDEA